MRRRTRRRAIIFEAYAIGITLKLNNLISAQLSTLATEFTRLDGLVLGLNKSLKAIGGESAALRQITAGGNATAAAMERASRNTAELERRLAALRVVGNVPTGPSLTPLPGGGGGGGRGGHGGGFGGGNGFHGGNVHMGRGGLSLGSVGMAAGDAFVPLAITGAMVWGGHALYESAKDLNSEMQRFKLFGLSDKINKEAFNFVGGMKVYGTSQAENMKAFREAQGVFRESGLDDSHALEGAKIAAPVLGKINFATEALDGESKARMRTSSLAMLRFIEMSGGLKDAGTFNRLADFGWKMVQTSGGTVDWEQLRQFKATSGVSGRSLTDDAIAGLEPVISELKGGRTGTSLRTAFNRLSGIVKLPNQAAHELMEGGIWDRSKVVLNGNGGIKSFKGNPFTSSDEFQKDPAAWYFKYMVPMYDKKKLTDEQRAREDAMLFGSTGGSMFSLIRTMRPTIERSIAANHKALGINASAELGKNGLAGQEAEFSASWTDFKAQFGTAVLPAFTAILKDGAIVLRGIGDFLREHEGLITFLRGLAGGVATHMPGMGIFSMFKGLGGGAGSVNAVQPAGGAPTQVHTDVHLDGQKIASVVTRHQEQKLQRPQSGSRWFDSGQSLPPVNLAF